MNEQPRMRTIRETAKLGILPEYALRKGAKRGTIPGFYAGSRFYVNLDALIEKLSKAPEVVRENAE